MPESMPVELGFTYNAEGWRNIDGIAQEARYLDLLLLLDKVLGDPEYDNNTTSGSTEEGVLAVLNLIRASP